MTCSSADSVREAAAEEPPIRPEQVAELEQLAGDLGRAARIRERTEARFIDTLQARIAASAGVAIHPDAIRAAAQNVADAQELVAVADKALADLGEHLPSAAPPPTPPPAPPPPAASRRPRLAHAPWHFDHGEGEDPSCSARTTCSTSWPSTSDGPTRGLAVFLVVAGIGIIAVALGQTAIGGVALLAAAAAGVFVAVRGHRAAARRAEVDATTRLDSYAESPAESRPDVESSPTSSPRPTSSPSRTPTPSPRASPSPNGRLASPSGRRSPPPRPGPGDELWQHQRTALLAEQAEAVERVPSATTRWHQLAGADADPHDPEPVIRAHDPQLHYDPQVAEDSPTVRTVAALHRSLQARWRVLWASFGGVDDPPPPEELSRPWPSPWARRSAPPSSFAGWRQPRTAAARAIVGRPLVLVEPRTWISEGRLSLLLSSIPPEGQAVVVERPPAPAEGRVS